MLQTPFDDLHITRPPLNLYGSLENMVRRIRVHRPLDLNAERWHKTYPNATSPLSSPSASKRTSAFCEACPATRATPICKPKLSTAKNVLATH